MHSNLRFNYGGWIGPIWLSWYYTRSIWPQLINNILQFMLNNVNGKKWEKFNGRPESNSQHVRAKPKWAWTATKMKQFACVAPQLISPAGELCEFVNSAENSRQMNFIAVQSGVCMEQRVAPRINFSVSLMRQREKNFEKRTEILSVYYVRQCIALKPRARGLCKGQLRFSVWLQSQRIRCARVGKRKLQFVRWKFTSLSRN